MNCEYCPTCKDMPYQSTPGERCLVCGTKPVWKPLAEVKRATRTKRIDETTSS